MNVDLSECGGPARGDTETNTPAHPSLPFPLPPPTREHVPPRVQFPGQITKNLHRITTI
ncbi:hypothetical protein O3P69_017512 [Scylla paramamosain]|uniref:Uncharacterized protein n=1 Tax=Scylla paramamosain TaxID=85552 RepID=A0AAW0TVZ7_SCYPA